jgi:hypothetical protein
MSDQVPQILSIRHQSEKIQKQQSHQLKSVIPDQYVERGLSAHGEYLYASTNPDQTGR